MKKFLFIITLIFSVISCKQSGEEKNTELAMLDSLQQEYKSFGEQISPENSLSAEEMKLKFDALMPGDTITAKFSTTVNGVCKMKGCWMTLDIPGSDEDPMVKFRDYSFFVPKDIEGKEVIVEGIAFIEETSVEDQKHFAEDGGKSKEEIEAISEPKRTPGFLAKGVLLKE